MKCKPAYTSNPVHTWHCNGTDIASFVRDDEENIHHKTVRSFGEEWTIFHSFSEDEIQSIGNDYFDLLDFDTSSFIVLDVGCGSGRWSKYLSPRVAWIEAIDPSVAVRAAAHTLKYCNNVRISQAGVNNIPFPDNAFDLVFSLGVLHHVPDTAGAIVHCYNKVKPGGFFCFICIITWIATVVSIARFFSSQTTYVLSFQNYPCGSKNFVRFNRFNDLSSVSPAGQINQPIF